MNRNLRTALVVNPISGGKRSDRPRRALVAAFRELEALVLCGAFGFTGQTRPELLFRLRAAPMRPGKPENGPWPGLFDGDFCPSPQVGLPEYDDWKGAMLEIETLGLFVTRHPMSVLRPG